MTHQVNTEAHNSFRLGTEVSQERREGRILWAGLSLSGAWTEANEPPQFRPFRTLSGPF